ncbi:hypothetical protein FXO38_14027 [Capsicum annuum]|nr:hypothetical protein FXO38_14027 [Capsicum annuum]
MSKISDMTILLHVGWCEEELEQLDLPQVSIASYHPGTSSMPSSTVHSNPISPYIESKKSVEMEGPNVHQTPSPVKEGQHAEMDAGIEQIDDIVVEEMKPLENIIPVSMSDMTLIFYKPSSTTPDEDCGIFVAVFAEYLSEGLGITTSDIDAQYHHLRYVILLGKYGSKKVYNGYFNENDNPSRPRSSFIPTEKTVF